MPRVLGIDLGGSAVRVAVLEGSFGRYEVKELHSREVHMEDPAHGPDLDARLEALASLLDEEELSDARWAAVGWPTQDASVHVVELPFDDRKKVEQVLPFEVENHVPFHMDDMVMDFRTLSRQAGKSRLLTALASRQGVAAVMEGVRSLGVEPRYLPVDADLLGVFGEEGGQVIMDLGYTRVLCSLVLDGQVQAFRAVQIGGRELLQRVSLAFQVDAAVASTMLEGLALSDAAGAVPVAAWDDEEGSAVARDAAGEDRLETVVRQGLHELVTELRATLISLEDAHEVEVDEVLITGGLSGLEGLGGYLSQELGVPVRPLVQGSMGVQRPDARVFSMAIALGRRAVDNVRGRPLDMRAGEFAHHGTLEILKTVASYAAVAAFFFTIATVMVFAVRHHRVAEQEQLVSEQISSLVISTFPELSSSVLSDPGMAVAVMQEQTQSITSQVELLSSAVRGEPPTLTLLKELSEAMPPPSEAVIDVRELTMGESALSLRAETGGYDAAARIEASLQNTSRFKAASKGDEKKAGDKVSFSLTIPLGSVPGQEQDDG